MDGSERHQPDPATVDVRGELARGRACYRARAWAGAHEALSRADGAAPLGGEDLELLAVSAYLIGRDDDYLHMLERAYQAHLTGGACAPAARAAFWLGLRLLFRGEAGSANGWLGRAERLLERQGQDCVERGYLALLVAQQNIGEAAWEAAHASAARAVAAGERFAEPDLVAAALHLQGRILMQQGQVDEGLSLLDQAMVEVKSGRLSPVITGLLYCSAIEGYREVHALDRACEWTDALERWCSGQPEMVAFVGVCQVHRAEILHLRGAWSDALAEARRACERCRGVNDQATAAAFYQQGEAHRLRGEFEAAEEAYRNASQWGWEPQPGLALLRLGQGRTRAALAAIRRVVGATAAHPQRPGLLAAQVEITLAVGDTGTARRAGRELEAIAATFRSRALAAVAAHAMGAIELAEDNAMAAAERLRQAHRLWRELDAPYPAAQARVLLARCCRALGDEDGARLELEAARTVFEKLGAAPDLARLDPGACAEAAVRPAGLTRRELEVLRLVAAGKSNKAIARALFLSERTVERHLSNIFRKLEVASRSAATAHAYRHALV